MKPKNVSTVPATANAAAFSNARTLVANSMFEECSSLNLPGSTWMGPFRLRVVLLPQAMAGKAANSPPVSAQLKERLPQLAGCTTKVRKFHNFATDDAPSTPHWCTSITPSLRALDEILHLTWAKLPSS
jgi:hypothetical protein